MFASPTDGKSVSMNRKKSKALDTIELLYLTKKSSGNLEEERTFTRKEIDYGVVL